ncbi:MAG: YceD family protein [Dermatophilaceae bacterium]
MTRLDPRAPLVLDTRELRRRPGSMLELDRQLHTQEALGTEIVAVPAGAVLDLALRVEAVSEGILLSGTVRSSATGMCVRCLDPVRLAVEAPLQELFVYGDRAAHHHEVSADPDDADVHELAGDLLDLEPVLRDAMVPALPFQPVCRPDCPGLCSECGARLADDPGHHHDVFDARWAALRTLPLAPPETEEKRN